MRATLHGSRLGQQRTRLKSRRFENEPRAVDRLKRRRSQRSTARGDGELSLEYHEALESAVACSR